MSEKRKRTTITVDEYREVILTYQRDGETFTETYKAGIEGGYVYRRTPTGVDQVSSDLGRFGDMLFASSRERLPDLIRAAHRRRSRSRARAFA